MSDANGRLPDSALGLIPGTNQRVRADLVGQVAALRAAFAQHFGKPLQVTDGYRSYDAQVRVKKAKGNLAATPGTSNHGWGLATDLGSGVNVYGSPEWRWMVDNGPRFGAHWPAWAQRGNPRFLKDEPWHHEWTPKVIPGTPPQSHSLAPVAAQKPAPHQIPEEEHLDTLTALYLSRLGRKPDIIGATTYLSAIADGSMTWPQVAKALSDSPESKAFAALGDEAKRNAQRAKNGAGWLR